MDLIDSLIQSGWLKTSEIIRAFQKIKRADFLGDDMKSLAELNEALPIGCEQTISQPLTVAFMLEQLRPKAGQKILDVGSGSGWTSALLSQITGEEGKVIALEIIPELKKFGEKNTAKYNFVKSGIARFVCANGSEGYKKEAPYDRILASAAAEARIPAAWKEQLKINGRIVAPLENSIWTIIKKSESDFEEIEHPGFAFVPLINQ